MIFGAKILISWDFVELYVEEFRKSILHGIAMLGITFMLRSDLRNFQGKIIYEENYILNYFK